MSVSEWIDAYIPGGVKSDFGALCVSAVLDEFGGPPEEESALNLVYLLGQDDSTPNGAQPRERAALGGANEKWHIHGGTDLLISGLIDRLPAGTVSLGEKLVALRTSEQRGYVCSFESGGSTHDVKADHVVLALPFTTLRLVDSEGCLEDDLAPAHACHRRGAAREQFQVLRPVRHTGLEHGRPRNRKRVLRRRSSKAHGTRRSTSRARPASSPPCPVAPTRPLGLSVSG